MKEKCRGCDYLDLDWECNLDKCVKEEHDD